MCGPMASVLGSYTGSVDLCSCAVRGARAACLRLQVEMREMRQGVLKTLTDGQKEKEREQLQQEVGHPCNVHHLCI